MFFISFNKLAETVVRRMTNRAENKIRLGRLE